MATTITITPNNTSLNATSQTTTLTISSAVGGSASDAAGITLSNPVGTLSSQSNVENALNFLANQFYVATTAPSANTQDLAEGDLFYDTDDNQLKVYRDVDGSATFVPIMIGNDSADSDTIDAGAF
jgi:isocitrate/isopropylmalate dehydrogenase